MSASTRLSTENDDTSTLRTAAHRERLGGFSAYTQQRWELRDAWAQWLRTFRWDWFATPTFRPTFRPPGDNTDNDDDLGAYEIHDDRVREIVEDEWLGWIRLTPLPDLYAAVCYERGRAGGHTHAHLLIGGLGRHPAMADLVRDSWRWGRVDVAPYDPRRGATHYMLKDGPEGVALWGTPIPYRPHRRRRGGKGGST